MADTSPLIAPLGRIDIYLLDQVLRGRVTPGMTVLDAGCGDGRNIELLLRLGCEVLAADVDPSSIAAVRRRAAELAPGRPASGFRVESLDELSFDDGCADVVVACAVLHFARDEAHFDAMLDELWRVLAPGGLFFARLASDIGLAHRMRRLQGRRFALPDGSERFLVDADLLRAATARLGGTLADPLKTTLVEELRSMTTWVMRRG